MKPFLKWPGNKYRIIHSISDYLPDGKRLVEPFMGSGAVFLNTDYPRFLLAEGNRDLVGVYGWIKKEGEIFIEYCQSFFEKKHNNQRKYYANRLLFNQTSDSRLKAALFLYLNRHGYNGLCRYNLKGGYNVPFGYYLKPYFPEKEMLFFHKRLKKASVRHADFLSTLNKAKKGDVVYCDPPYAPLSTTASFTQYAPIRFTTKEQLLLVEKAKELAAKGIPVLISNHDTSFIRKAYKGAELIPIKVRRSISCKGQKRTKAPEILALFS